jgi:predicted permease
VLNRSARFDGLYLVPDLMETAGLREAVDPAVARLKPRVSAAVVQQQFDAVAERLDPELRRGNQLNGPRVLVEPLRSAMFWNVYRYLWLVALAASLVGLLACANLSSLLIARGRSREQQLALRAALGASSRRLLVTELAQGLIICAAAAAISILILFWAAASLRAVVPTHFRPYVLGTVDVRVLTFAMLAALVATLIAGAWPAWRASRTSLITVMQRAAGTPAHSRRGRAGRTVLVIEAAIGVVLVASAAIVVRSFIGLATADMGFTAARLQELRVQPMGVRRGGDDVAELARYRGILEVLRQQPGVVAAGAVDSMPSGGAAPMTGFEIGQQQFGLWQMTDGFLSTIGARLVAGADITRRDVDENRLVAVVTEAAARRLWPDVPTTAVVGRDIAAPDEPTRRVIGVINDIRDRPDEAPRSKVFIPVRTDGFWYLEYAVRTDGSPLNGESIRRVIGDRYGVTSVAVRDAGGSMTQALQAPRVQSLMFGSFGLMGLVLAIVGLFAVTTSDVAARRNEIGIRVALGASAGQVRTLIVRDALVPVVGGVVIGLAGASWTAQFIQSLVHGVDARDPWTLALVAVTLIGTSIVAAWLPARRAARTDPAVVLRSI